METPLAFEGQDVKLGGTVYTVPPIDMKQLKQFTPIIKEIGSKDGDALERITKGLPIILAAVKRNYPAVTAEQLEELVDMANFRLMLNAALGVPLDFKGKLGEI